MCVLPGKATSKGAGEQQVIFGTELWITYTFYTKGQRFPNETSLEKTEVK